MLEGVLFKTSQKDRSRLFDHIYKKIDKNESDRVIADEELQLAVK
jgi:hypothetical protein